MKKSAMETEDMFPRELSAREFAWIAWLLPEGQPGYEKFRSLIRPLFVIGEGRWGRQDYVLGPIGAEIDRTEGMRPVVAFGTILCDSCSVTLSLHEPNEDGLIEFQLASSTNEPVPNDVVEISRWTYSTWSPGTPCPATGQAVREISLPAQSGAELRLVVSNAKSVLWLYNHLDRTNTLIPVTNFYNELVIGKHIRDPRIALNHALLFSDRTMFSDSDLVQAFVRYNVLYKKVNVGMFDSPQQRGSFLKRLFGKKSS